MVDAKTKLAVLERLIEAMRWVRSEPDHPEYQTFLALRSIAADVRARLPENIGSALAMLDDRMSRVVDSGHDVSQLRALGDEVVGRWPLIRQAIERFASVDTPEDIASDWFTLPPKLRTKENLIHMLRGEKPNAGNQSASR